VRTYTQGNATPLYAPTHKVMPLRCAHLHTR